MLMWQSLSPEGVISLYLYTNIWRQNQSFMTTTLIKTSLIEAAQVLLICRGLGHCPESEDRRKCRKTKKKKKIIGQDRKMGIV